MYSLNNLGLVLVDHCLSPTYHLNECTTDALVVSVFLSALYPIIGNMVSCIRVYSVFGTIKDQNTLQNQSLYEVNCI